MLGARSVENGWRYTLICDFT